MSEIRFPAHKGAMLIGHNDHKSIYQSVSEWLEDNTVYDWHSEQSKQRAIDADEVWTIHWYPDTPVGFCAVAAPTFEEALKLANED